MGSWHTGARIAEMIARLPGGAVLCLDEAYADFAPADALPPLDPHEPRVIRMRTFSKAHGMAGARIGYALGHPELVAAFDRVRNHFGVNRLAAAGALASLADRAWLAHVTAEVAAGRDRLARSPRRTASRRCPRPPTSSPSTAAATAPSPAASSTRSPPAASSSASPSSRRRTAASG